MLLLNSPEAASNYVTVGTVISASGAIIGVLIAVLRDMFKRQNETISKRFDEKFDEINERIDKLTDSHDVERELRHQLEKDVVEIKATLKANGCMTPGPSCDRTK